MCGSCNSCHNVQTNNCCCANALTRALRNLFSTSCYQTCNPCQSNGCLLSTLENLFPTSCGCNVRNRCCYNPCYYNQGCNQTVNLSNLTACGNYDAYYARQYALYPRRCNNCAISNFTE